MTYEEKTTKAKKMVCPVCHHGALRDEDWQPVEGLDRRMASFVCTREGCQTRFFILLRRNQY